MQFSGKLHLANIEKSFSAPQYRFISVGIVFKLGVYVIYATFSCNYRSNIEKIFFSGKISVLARFFASFVKIACKLPIVKPGVEI